MKKSERKAKFAKLLEIKIAKKSITKPLKTSK
jgi:hypothetical protein